MAFSRPALLAAIPGAVFGMHLEINMWDQARNDRMASIAIRQRQGVKIVRDNACMSVAQYDGNVHKVDLFEFVAELYLDFLEHGIVPSWVGADRNFNILTDCPEVVTAHAALMAAGAPYAIYNGGGVADDDRRRFWVNVGVFGDPAHALVIAIRAWLLADIDAMADALGPTIAAQVILEILNGPEHTGRLGIYRIDDVVQSGRGFGNSCVFDLMAPQGGALLCAHGSVNVTPPANQTICDQRKDSWKTSCDAIWPGPILDDSVHDYVFKTGSWRELGNRASGVVTECSCERLDANFEDRAWQQARQHKRLLSSGYDILIDHGGDTRWLNAWTAANGSCTMLHKFGTAATPGCYEYLLSGAAGFGTRSPRVDRFLGKELLDDEHGTRRVMTTAHRRISRYGW